MAVVKINNEAIHQLANGAMLRAFLQDKASAGVRSAEKIFDQEVKGTHNRTNEQDKHYSTGWYSGVRRVRDHLEGYYGNTAYDAVWVEVGAHAGGSGAAPILGYRPLGRSLTEAFRSTHVAHADVPAAEESAT